MTSPVYPTFLDDDDEKDRFRGGTTSRAAVVDRVLSYGSAQKRAASAGAVQKQPKKFAVLRVGKIKGMGHLGAAADHLNRDRETLNADPARISDNELLAGVEGSEAVRALWAERAPDKVRKNAVHALEYVVTASPGALDAMTPEEQREYFQDSVAFIAARHGVENILTAVVHRDERTPHLQALVIPLDEREKLNAREFVGGKHTLRQMQSDFSAMIGIRFGLERGIEKSQAKHQTIKEYYAKAQMNPEPDFSLPERQKGILSRENPEKYLKRAQEALQSRYADAWGSLTQQRDEARQEVAQGHAEVARAKELTKEAGMRVRTAERAAKSAKDQLSSGKRVNDQLRQELEQGKRFMRRLNEMGGGDAIQAIRNDLQKEDDTRFVREVAGWLKGGELTKEQDNAVWRDLPGKLSNLLSKEDRERLSRGDFSALASILPNQWDQYRVAREHLDAEGVRKENPSLRQKAKSMKNPNEVAKDRAFDLKVAEMSKSREQDLDDDMGL